jgi:hypothetical protein
MEKRCERRVELVPVAAIEQREELALLEQSDEIASTEYLRACVECDVRPTWQDVAFTTGVSHADPPDDRGRALYTQNRITMVIQHIWGGRAELDDRLVYKTVGGVRYLVGIDACATDLRLLKAVGLLPKDI